MERMIARYFEYAHLPPHLREISEPLCRLVVDGRMVDDALTRISGHLDSLRDRVVDVQQIEFAWEKYRQMQIMWSGGFANTDRYLLLLIEIKDCAVRACLK